MSVPRIALSALALVVLGAHPLRTSAHPDHVATVGERSLDVELGEDGGRLVYDVTYHAVFGLKLRIDADSDRDGQIDSEEIAAAARRHSKLIVTQTRLTIDGEEVAIDWQTPYIGPIEGRVARGPVAFEQVGLFDLSGTSLIFEDRAELEGVYRTIVTIDAQAPRSLISSGKGRTAPSTPQKQLVFLDVPLPGPPPERIITIVVDGGGKLSWRPVVAGAFVALVAVVGLVLVLRRGGARGSTSSS